MKEHRFRVWHIKEKKMYYRGYQKFFWVLLCEDDRGANGGRGRPVRRASYADCVFLEGTGCLDKNRKEIFEGDIVRVRSKEKVFEEVVGPPPDTFGSGGVHPLQDFLSRHGIQANPNNLEIEVIGNEYEAPRTGHG